jgi:predicted membrane-bound spermidine synthase
MAVIWSEDRDGAHYEVRSAGSTRRLYRNDVLHSAYHPSRVVTGGLWDLLFLPVLFYPPGAIQRVLVLGTGGGAVIHLLNRFAKPRSIAGIDIDVTHLEVARRFFDLQYPNLELIHADAVQWVRHYNGPPFDLVIEDLFTEDAGEPLRLMHDDIPWLQSLRNLLTPQGLAVINNGTDFEAKFTRKHAGRYASCFQLSTLYIQNRVLAFLNRQASTATLNKHIERDHTLYDLKCREGLNYRCRKVY